MLIITVCSVIAYQDFKYRAVLWLLFPILAIALFSLFYLNTSWEQLYSYVSINFLIVSTLLLFLYLYTKLIMKQQFLNVSFGLGDLFFFYAMTVGFPTLSFIVLFVGALIFSLFITIVYKSKMHTIPLAGLMGVYLICIFVISFIATVPSLHAF